jgi:hypothetical protein
MAPSFVGRGQNSQAPFLFVKAIREDVLIIDSLVTVAVARLLDNFTAQGLRKSLEIHSDLSQGATSTRTQVVLQHSSKLLNSINTCRGGDLRIFADASS